MTGANIKTTTTLSMSIETRPARAPTLTTNSGTLPRDIFSTTADRYAGTPDLPKKPEMTQMESRMAITFQSTNLKASMSVMTPKQIIAATPNTAAITLSNQPVITTVIVAKKMTIAIISTEPICKALLFLRILLSKTIVTGRLCHKRAKKQN